MKKKIAFLLACLLSAQLCTRTFALTDNTIFADPVQNTYAGRTEASTLIDNMNFDDMPAGHPAKESAVRSGALNMLKGYDRNFFPDNPISNQEAVSIVLRAIGMERLAQETAVAVQGQAPPDSTLRILWSIGYLNLALQIGLITPAQYADSIMADQTVLDPVTNFLRDAPATREQLADWLYRGLQVVNPELFSTTATQQYLYQYSDWDMTAVDKAPAMEDMLRLGIMTGDSGGLLYPKGNVTRGEMAQILKNMDTVYYSLQGFEKKTGTVGGFKDNQITSTGEGSLSRSFYIRRADGAIDMLQYFFTKSSSPQSGDRDCVVFKDGEVTGMASLNEGDEIEYLTNPNFGEVLYIQVVGTQLDIKTVQGVLQPLAAGSGIVTLIDSTGKTYSYNMARGLYGADGAANYVVINGVRRDLGRAPVGSRVELVLINEIVDEIRYIGEQNIVAEFRGIVLENNPALGYMTVVDNRSNEILKNYYSDDIRVKKIQHYDMGSGISYFSEMFPHFSYDPRESSVTEIEAGDIVYIRVDPDNPDFIASISASTNYVMRYGKIREFRQDDGFHNMLMEFEDKQTSWYEVPDSIFISRIGRPVGMADVRPGDWAKVLINQAVAAPGEIIESVKEITLEGDEHFISNIVKGQLAGLNAVQNQIMVQNAQILTKTGWSNYKNVEKFSIAGRDIEYYYDGKRITLDYAVQYLKRADGEVYIAMENNYTGEKVKKVTFRSGRDELLKPDTVVSADGNGNFAIISNQGPISTDSGTIVRRFGRLVDGHNIMIPDYAVVSLNGGSNAAVVDIVDAPDTSGVMIARGRILSVDDGKSFKVQSMAILTGNEWSYTPVQREFSIDYNTVFLNAEGIADSSTFIGYTEDTVLNRVFNVVVDGTRAARIADTPYALKAVRGTIYGDAGSGFINIKDASYYDNSTGKWPAVSYTNATATINVPSNAIIIKNNAVVPPSSLEIGDHIRVMTETLPDRILPGLELDGYIILVEK